jgi:hypothetical protein
MGILSAIWIILVPIKNIAIASVTPSIYFIKVTVVLFVFFLISLILIFKARDQLIKLNFLSDLLLAILISSIFAQFLFSESNFVLNGNDIQDQLSSTSYLQDFILYNFFLISLLVLRKWTQPSIRKKILLGAVIWTVGLLLSTIFSYTIGTVQKNNELLAEQKYTRFEYSNYGGTLFIVLDSFQGSYFDQIVNQYPSELSFLDGFKYFPDTVAAYPTTRGSSTNFSTGSFNLNSQETQLHIKTQNHFIDYFKENNYSLDLTVIPIGGSEYNFDAKDISASQEVVFRGSITDIIMASVNQLEISLFKLAPNVLKPFIYNNGNWVVSRIVDSSSELLVDRDSTFLSDFQESKFLSNDEEKIFHFYHLEGAHFPLRSSDHFPEARLESSGDPILDNSRVALYKLRILLEELKEIKAYDSLQIVVASDHGLGIPKSENLPGSTEFEIESVQAAADALLLVKPRNGFGKLDLSSKKMSLSDVPCLLTSGEFVTGCKQVIPKIWKSNDQDHIRRFFSYDWQHKDWRSPFLPPLQEFYVNGDSSKISNWGEVVSVNDSRNTEDLDFAPVGSLLQIGAESVSKYLILNGFSGPEGTHRWSMGSMSNINFKVKPEYSKKGLKVEIGIVPFQDTQLGKKVIIFVNNKYLKAISLENSSAPTLLDIPKSFLNDEEIKIAFETPGSISPLILGNSSDSRLLGRLFSTFKVIGN